MPRIVEYTAPTKQVNPSDRPQAAWETAGRRVGPLYNAAAQDIRQAGAVQGQMEKDKIWPFDIYALEAANAPQVRNTTSTETTIRPAPPATTGGARGSTQATGLMLGDGTSQGADYTNQYANAGYATTPESAANAANDWTANHGEASAGAVGMSRMARAAARGDLSISDQVKRMGSAPSGDVPLNWRDLPEYNGNHLITGADGGQYTPYQMQQIKERQDTRDYRDEQRQQAADDRYQRNIDKWNRQQYQQWDGPNGFNTRRDKWIDGTGGINDQWQQDYNRDLIAQGKMVDKYMKDNPNADVGEVQRNAYNARHVTPSVQSNYGSYSDDSPDYRIRYGAPTVGDYARYAPSAVVDSVKSTFNRMFGSDEPAATADIE